MPVMHRDAVLRGNLRPCLALLDVRDGKSLWAKDRFRPVVAITRRRSGPSPASSPSRERQVAKLESTVYAHFFQQHFWRRLREGFLRT